LRFVSVNNQSTYTNWTTVQICIKLHGLMNECRVTYYTTIPQEHALKNHKKYITVIIC